MLSGIIIDDGYNEDHTIPAAEGHWPELHLNIRPFTSLEVASHREKTNKMTEVQAKEHFSKMIAPRISTWDLEDHKGNPVPVSPDMLQRLKPELYMAIFKAFVGDSTQKTNDAKN